MSTEPDGTEPEAGPPATPDTPKTPDAPEGAARGTSGRKGATPSDGETSTPPDGPPETPDAAPENTDRLTGDGAGTRPTGDGGRAAGDGDRPSRDADQTPGDADRTAGDAAQTSGDAARTTRDADQTAADSHQPPADTDRTPGDAHRPTAGAHASAGDRDQASQNADQSPADPADSADPADPADPADSADAAGTDGASGGGSAGSADEGAARDAAQRSEAEAEIAAQRVERERIARRKAEKAGPVAAGTKLSGKAADLLAAVRAVESGEKPSATVFAEPKPEPAREPGTDRAPGPRGPAPEAVRQPEPVAAHTPAAPTDDAVAAVRQVLSAGDAPEALAPQTAAALGEDAPGLLREDPWLLLRVTGVRPEQADGFARALLGAECRPDDERRGRAVTCWLLEQAALAGHTALDLPALVTALERRGVPDPDTAVQSALAEGEALVFHDALDEPAAGGTGPGAEEGGGSEERGEREGDDAAERPVRILVGLERYALAEESLADGLARLINSVPKQDGSAEEWERAAASAEGAAADLIRAVAGHGLVLHTGSEASLAEPAALLDAAHALGLRAWAATHSPVGRDRFAARVDGPGTATVHDLLAGVHGPGRDPEGAFDLDLLVVLDAPQLDVESAALLTESLPDGARLVLAGDPAVLGSAGPGRVFADLLAARHCPQIASRRPDPGPLGELVSGIGVGELNQVEAPGKEIVIVPVRDAREAVHRTVQLVADSVPRAIGVPAEQTVVVTPGHGGAAGTRVLNAALKKRLNPGPGRFAGFDPGDRVVHSPAPGRSTPGTVVTADAAGLHLSCAGEPVVVAKDQVTRSVRHGWAITAHQAVGARWPAVVVVLPGDAAQTLDRPWVYTAFSRADRHLSVVHGVEQALPRAVAELPAKPRTTRLPVLLRPQVPTAD
ncbi:helix-hairpin-helix domain-containing protein [Streptomyces sp. NPDC091377]|uniref:helix-hairpin-helix domain-containing protein n=1 Tax=Streptomyces sp. NPDC091377 TaxID=3365995 RepID=UPI0038253CB0